MSRKIVPPSHAAQRTLRLLGAICASTSLLALVAHIAGILPLPFFLTFFGVPSVLLLMAMAAYAHWIDAGVFVHSLVLGLVAGLTATATYDLVRVLVQATGLFEYNAFRAIQIFGSWISGRPESAVPATVAGWTFHYWNGISFAVFFLLAFGRRPWWYGLVYGLVMEAAMLGLFPLFLRVSDDIGFLSISLIGHAVYGSVLGLFAQRYGRSWPGTRSA